MKQTGAVREFDVDEGWGVIDAASISAGATTGIDLATAMVEEDLGSAVGDSPGTAGGVAPRVASIWHHARP